ncbi:MAG TPA: heparinase II/III family protein, partial [Verrucomicrobiae bacterium]|nr:heparinase II/III family protein [Verrucomicrobiae bacterium]
GTGAYHADKPLRTWLASRQAHNGPCPVGVEFPRRTGPFLWREEHDTPRLELSGGVATATLKLPGATVRRSIRQRPDQNGWEVSDACEGKRGTAQTFTVRWQFPPGSRVKRTSERAFRICRAGSVLIVEVAKEWNDVQLIRPIVDPAGEQSPGTSAPAGDLEGIVSPAFRQICRAPFLKLTARGDKPCVFTTTFLASAHS